MMERSGPANLGAVWAEHRIPLMAALTSKLGDLDRAEDALSEAVLRAQQSWTVAIPTNPSGWLYRVALNAARDQQRRTATRTRAEPSVTSHIEHSQNDALTVSPSARLRLFARCTDPRLSSEQQIALMLYHLAGLDCAAIAKAFLVKEATIYQRLSRARAKLRQQSEDVEPDLPSIRSALEVIYLQSYRDVAGGPDADALGRDALQLTQALCEASPDEAESWALLAFLNALEARRGARLSKTDAFIPFEDQDDRIWSAHHLSIAGKAMQSVARRTVFPSPYALRAQIELTRMIAKRDRTNPDAQLLALHDQWTTLSDSPFIRIERALILARLEGAEKAMMALDAIDADLSGHAGWHMAKAELHDRLGETAQARLHYNAALKLVETKAEHAFITERRDRMKS